MAAVWRQTATLARQHYAQAVGEGALTELLDRHAAAYGVPGQVSYYTAAVLAALDGLGCEEDEDQLWIARSDLLPSAIKYTLERRCKRDEAPEHVGGAARRERHDHVHRAGRPRLRLRERCGTGGEEGERGAQRARAEQGVRSGRGHAQRTSASQRSSKVGASRLASDASGA